MSGQGKKSTCEVENRLDETDFENGIAALNRIRVSYWEELYKCLKERKKEILKDWYYNATIKYEVQVMSII